MGKQAIAYLRISSDPQDERLGVERQRADVQQLAEHLGVSLTAVFEDNDVSAYTTRKADSAWAKVLTTIQQERPEYLLVYRQDRIGRRLADIEGLDELCRRTGTKVHAAQGGDVFANPAWPMLAAVAKMESQNTSARVRRANEARLSKGLSTGGGQRPYGFRKDRVHLNHPEVLVLRDVARRVISGESLYSIANSLNELEVRTTTGRGKWRVPVLRHMLHNPRYVGENTHLGKVVGPAAWEAVFDRPTWEALQAALPRVQQAPHGKKAKSLLTGLLRCGRCHTPMVSSGWTERQAYRCNMSVGGCGKVTRNRAILDAYVSSALLEHFSNDVLRSERIGARRALRRTSRAYDEIGWSIEAARVAFTEDRLDSEDFYPIYDDLRRKRNALRRQLAEARTRDEAAKQAGAAKAQWDAWSLEQKRMWIRQRVAAVVVYPPGQGRRSIRPGEVVIQYAKEAQLSSAT